MSLIGHVRLQPSSRIAEWDTLNHLCFLSYVCNWSPVEQTCLPSPVPSTLTGCSLLCSVRGTRRNCIVLYFRIYLLPTGILIPIPDSKQSPTPPYASQVTMTSSISSQIRPCLLSLCPRRLDHPVSALCPVSVCVFGRKIDQSRHFLWEILLL